MFKAIGIARIDGKYAMFDHNPNNPGYVQDAYKRMVESDQCALVTLLYCSPNEHVPTWRVVAQHMSNYLT